MGGLVPGPVEEDYLATPDLSSSEDVSIHHVLDIALDRRSDSAYSPGDAVEAVNQPRILVEKDE